MANVKIVQVDPSAVIELTPEELKGLSTLLHYGVTTKALDFLQLHDLHSKILTHSSFVVGKRLVNVLDAEKP